MPPLDSDRIAGLRSALSHWELPPIVSIDPLHKEHVFRVTTVSRTLTLKDLGTQPPDSARHEFTCDVLEHVATSGLVVPVPIRARSGRPWVTCEDRHYLLYIFVEAEPYPEEPTRRRDLFDQVGQAIATLHTALASYPDPDVASRTWSEDHASSIEGWVERLCDGLPSNQSTRVDAVAQLRVDGVRSALSEVPKQLIHRDCHPGNVLVRDLCVVGFIDCDHLSIGQAVFDLATYALTLIKWSVDDDERTKEWLEQLLRLISGYDSRRALSDAEITAIPHAMAANSFLMAQWFLRVGRMEPIEVEVRCLEWLHRNFDRIREAIA